MSLSSLASLSGTCLSGGSSLGQENWLAIDSDGGHIYRRDNRPRKWHQGQTLYQPADDQHTWMTAEFRRHSGDVGWFAAAVSGRKGKSTNEKKMFRSVKGTSASSIFRVPPRVPLPRRPTERTLSLRAGSIGIPAGRDGCRSRLCKSRLSTARSFILSFREGVLLLITIGVFVWTFKGKEKPEGSEEKQKKKAPKDAPKGGRPTQAGIFDPSGRRREWQPGMIVVGRFKWALSFSLLCFLSS